MEVTINLPEDVAKVISADGENLEREVLEATALEGYREGKLSHAQVSRMLGFTRFETDAFFKEHNVPLNYTVEDLPQDREHLINSVKMIIISDTSPLNYLVLIEQEDLFPNIIRTSHYSASRF